MNIKKTELHGVLLVESDYHEDRRGSFIKVLSDINDTRRTLNITSREIYYSISKKNVIRGMHFQIPPKQHSKFVYLIDGKVRDVILVIRSDSPT